MSTLTEEEKRHIEEKVKYENEIRARYAQSPASTNTDSHGKKTYADQLSKAEIRDVIIPQFARAEQITKTVETKATGVQDLLEKRNVLEKEMKRVPSAAIASFICCVPIIIWCILSYNVQPSFEEYTMMSSVQKIQHLPTYFVNSILASSAVSGFVDKHVFLGFLFALFLMFGIPIIVSCCLGSLLTKLYMVLFKKKKYSALIKDNTEKAATINSELMDYYNDHIADIAFLPEKYQNHDAASHILELFQTCRVDSMKEAFNKYEEDLHNRHVERGFESLNKTVMVTNSLLSDLSLSIDQIRNNTSRIK